MQAGLYGEVFDRATLVTAERFASAAMDVLPAWWEVVVVVPDGDSLGLEVLREGAPNPSPSARTQAEFIWRDDALGMLEARGASRGLHRKPRRVIWDRLCAVYTADEIASEVRTLLKARTIASEVGESSP